MTTEEVNQTFQRLTWLDIIETLAKRWRLLAGATFGSGLVAAAISLVMTPVYTATATIAPPQSNSNLASLAVANLSQGSFLGGLLGGGSGVELYAGMIKSRTIADRIIARFRLKELYGHATMVQTRKALDNNTRVYVSKEGIIYVDVDDDDPKRAAAMANAYVEELDRLTSEVAVTDASRRRLFFERQLAEAKNSLGGAEAALKTTQEKTGLIALNEQGRVLIEAIAGIRAQLAAREVQLAAIRSYATAENPEVSRLRAEVSGLRSELTKLEQTERSKDQSTLVPAGNVPAAGLEYVRKLREVKYQETLFELLARQFELARAEEARDSGQIQAIDKAVPPDQRSKPKKRIIVVMTMVVVAIFGCVLVVCMEVLRRSVAAPSVVEQISRIRRHLSVR